MLPISGEHGNDSFRKSTPEERAMRANQRPSQIDGHNAMSPVATRGSISRSFINSPVALKSVMSNARTTYSSASQGGARSPFSIQRAGMGGMVNFGKNNSPKPQKEQIGIISPTGGHGHLHRRSTLQPPPIGDRNQAWGKYDTIQEIMSRPLPPPAVELGQHKTMSMQGGRWSYHQPINHLYVLSRTSIQTPGPGQYGQAQPNGDWGAPDPVITGKTTPFGRIKGGRVSVSPLRTHSDDLCRVARSVPGPGAYDTDHLFGIYARIVSAIPKSRKQVNDSSMHRNDEDHGPDSDADSTPRCVSRSSLSLSLFVYACPYTYFCVSFSI